MTTFKWEDLFQHGPTALAAVAGAGGVFYALGFVIVNTSLVSTGVRNIELTRPNYVTAGITFVIFLGVAIVLPALAALELRQTSKALFVVLPPFASGVLLILILIVITGRPQWLASTILIPFVVFSTAILAFILSLRSLDQPILLFLRSVWGIVLAIIAPVAVIVMLLVWGWGIYPQMDQVFGGPRRDTVQLVIAKPETSHLFTSIGVNLVNDYLTESLELFDISSEFLVVELDDGNGAVIDRELVANIVYVESALTITPTPSPCQCTPTATLTPTSTSTPTVTPTPVQCHAQQVSWAPYCFDRGTGVCINDCLDFIPWDQVKYEIEMQVLPKVAGIPNGSILRLSEDAKGRPDQIVEISDPHGNKIGFVWFGPDPSNNWAFDGLVRVTSHLDPSQVWGTFQRYSDGSYATLW